MWVRFPIKFICSNFPQQQHTQFFIVFRLSSLLLPRHPRNATHQLARELIWVWNTRRNEQAMCCMLCAKIFSNCCRSSRENFYTFRRQGNLLPSWLESENSLLRHERGTGDRWSVCVVGGLECGINLKLFACRTSFVESSFWDAERVRATFRLCCFFRVSSAQRDVPLLDPS